MRRFVVRFRDRSRDGKEGVYLRGVGSWVFVIGEYRG